jgi:ACS family glucarate transporter-like MFS transporter
MLAAIILPAAFLMQFDRQAMVVLAPMIQSEFHLDLLTITQVLSAMAVCYALCQIPSAWFAGRIGPALTIGLCVIGWSVALFSTAFAIGPVSLLFLRGALGIVQAPEWVASVMLLKSEVPVRLRSRATAALFGAGYLGKFFSGPVSTQIASHRGWRFSFLIFGAIGLAFGAFITFVVKRSRYSRPHSLPDKTLPIGRLFEDLKQSRFHLLAIAYLCFSGVQSFVVVMLPLYLRSQRHSSLIEIGWLASAPYVVLYLALVMAGVLSDAIYQRTSSLFVARIPLAVLALLGSGACFAAGISMHETWSLIAFLCGGMVFVGIGQVVLWAIIQDATADASGYLSAWVQVFVWLGLWLVPVLMAKVVAANGGGWANVRILLLGLSGVGAACLLVAERSACTAGHKGQMRTAIDDGETA